MQTLTQTGLIYTNDNCIGCHRCISVCPVITANHAVELGDGTCRIEVDGSKCIACGACFDACEHHARDFRDDTERFFEDLEKGENISVLWAPAFAANYPDEYEGILGGLKKKGANHIISISFGADITTWGYLKYITENDFWGGISQPCPAVVNYIEHFAPELIPKLVPVHSPLMCGAVYVKKYMKISDKLAFISPCIAKKREISDENTDGMVTYNVVFDHLIRYVREHDIFAEPAPNEIEYGLGSIYPMPGGLKENIHWFCGEDVFVRQIEGEKRAYHFLDDYKERVLAGKELPFMVDALNCSAGCLYGTGVEETKTDFDDTLYELMRIRSRAKGGQAGAAWNGVSPAERLRALNEQFGELDIRDFIRHYTDKSAECKIAEPSYEQRQEIFRSMKKNIKEKQNINCSACGYDTCSQMATAIFNGCNQAGNCVHYSKDIIREEKMQVADLLNEVEIGAAASTARTHYMEKLYTEVAQDVKRWTQEAARAIDSGDSAEYGRKLSVMRDQGDKVVDYIQDTLVSIRRTNRGLNLVERVYSPEKLVWESVQFVEDINAKSRNMIRIVHADMLGSIHRDMPGGLPGDIYEDVPKKLYGDRQRIFRILTVLLYEMDLNTDKELYLAFSMDRKEYAVFLRVKIEAQNTSCEDVEYGRFEEYLHNQPRKLEDADEYKTLSGEFLSDFSMVDIFVRQLYGSLQISGTRGEGWSCTLRIPQVEPVEGNR